MMFMMKNCVFLYCLSEKISIKISYQEGKEVNIQPEFSDCLKLAKKSDLSVKEIMKLVLKEFYKEREKSRKD